MLAHETTPALGAHVTPRLTSPYLLITIPGDVKTRIRTVAGPTMSTPQDEDPVIRQFREQISDNDRAIVDAVNKRLNLVAQVKAYKESRGLGFLDPEREEWMLQYLSRANRGPLSAEGLQELFRMILDLSKREVAGGPASSPRFPRSPRPLRRRTRRA